MFPYPEIEYLTWAREAYEKPPEGAIDLCTSGTPWVVPEDLGLHVNHVAELHAPEHFRDAVAKRFAVPSKNVAVALGASCAVYTVCRSVIRPGEIVAVETPSYEPLWKVPAVCGAQVVRFERTVESGFALEPDRVMAALGPSGRIAIVTDLHNPTGAVADPDALAEIARRLAARDGYLIVDEAYRDFMIPRDGLVTARWLGGNVVTMASLTKVYGMAWARAGWILAPSRIATAAEEVGYYVAGRYGYGYGAAGCAALEQIDSLLERALKLAGDKMTRADAWIRSRPDLEWHCPAAGIFGFPMLRSRKAIKTLIDGPATERKLIMADGRFYGLPFGFRLGLASPAGDFERGLAELGEALDAWGSR